CQALRDGPTIDPDGLERDCNLVPRHTLKHPDVPGTIAESRFLSVRCEGVDFTIDGSGRVVVDHPQPVGRVAQVLLEGDGNAPPTRCSIDAAGSDHGQGERGQPETQGVFFPDCHGHASAACCSSARDELWSMPRSRRTCWMASSCEKPRLV